MLRTPSSRVGGPSLHEILDKIDLLRSTKHAAIKGPDNYLPRLAQMAREGARHTAQALQQMGPARRFTTLVETLRELEDTLSDAAISKFSAVVGRSKHKLRTRMEESMAGATDKSSKSGGQACRGGQGRSEEMQRDGDN